ncbi:hypothetical protein ACLOJK_022289 [Asimina triloba]
MSYYARGGGDLVDDFDEFDPTPYSGGYDQALIYGPPISPCEETCYTISSSEIDYDRPNYSSYSHTSSAAAPYSDEYSQEDRYGVTHSCAGGGEGMTYGSSEGYPPRRRPQDEEGGGYGYGSDRPERHGDDYAPPPPRQERYGEGDDDDRRRQQGYGFDSDRPGRYGEGDYPPPRRHQEEEGYGGDYPPPRRPQEEEGYGGDYPPPRRPQEEEGYGGDYPPPRRHEEEGFQDAYPPPKRNQEEETYGYQGRKDDDEPRRYYKPSFDPDQEEGYGSRPKHKTSMCSYFCVPDCSLYQLFASGDDSDDEEKKHSHSKHHHHHRRKYDDDE